MFKSTVSSKTLTKMKVESFFAKGNQWYGKKELLANDLSNFNEIDVGAFQDQKDLVKIEIPDTILRIGNGAFIDCLRLKEVILPESIKSFGLAMFAGCFSLKKINIPSNFDYIPTATFADCSLLENVEIGNNIKKIGSRAFANCLSLKTIFIPESVEVIKENAFVNCLSLSKGIFSSHFYYQAHNFGLTESQFNILNSNLKAKISNEFLNEKKLISRDEYIKIFEKINVVQFVPTPVEITVPKALLKDKIEKNELKPMSTALKPVKQTMTASVKKTMQKEEQKPTKTSTALVVKKTNALKPVVKKQEKPKKVNGIDVTKKHIVIKSSEIEKYNYDKRRKSWHANAGYSDNEILCSICKGKKHTSVLTDAKKHICYNCFIKKPKN